MEQTWRWYGPNDPVSLTDIKQTGATGIVSALHSIPNGQVWSKADIMAHKALIEKHSLTWSVVESVPVHEEIKTRSGQFELWISNYQQTLANLAACGIDTVCYNFMPVLDWTRTDLAYELPDGSKVLRFDQDAFAAFDLYILQRPSATQDYSSDEKQRAQAYFDLLDAAQIETLTQNIIAGLPGAEEGYSLEQFQAQLNCYQAIDRDLLRENLKLFLLAITPTCESLGLRLAIHPDDPPRPILGLPRVVSTLEDLNWLMHEVPSKANGITMCTGSYGVRSDNDLVKMIETQGERIFFTHLRSTLREADNPLSFHETSHLHGDVDMFGVVKALLGEEQRRARVGDNRLIPMRPDHGQQMLDDLNKDTNPGYSCIGRLKGLAEVRGLEMGLKRAFFND